MSLIKWEKDFTGALANALSGNRFVLLFFHHPRCGGCVKTLEHTFTDPDVAELIGRDFAALSLVVTESQDLSARYRIEWTPTFVVTDAEGRELERWVGYLPPEDFIAQVYLSEGLAEFHRKRFVDAEKDFEWIIDHAPYSQAAPKARYFMGVALFKATGDDAHLGRTWEAMKKHYPGNIWTKKASAWS